MTALLMALTIKRNPLLHDPLGGRMQVIRIATRRDHKQEASFPQAIFLALFYFSLSPFTIELFKSKMNRRLGRGTVSPQSRGKLRRASGPVSLGDVKARRIAFPNV